MFYLSSQENLAGEASKFPKTKEQLENRRNVIDGDCKAGYVELWGECYSIENTNYLNKAGQGLTGEIPPEIGELINLENLDLSMNLLTGEIPYQLVNLPFIILDLTMNQLNGHLSENLCDIWDVNLNSNNFCPPYPDCLSNAELSPQEPDNCNWDCWDCSKYNSVDSCYEAYDDNLGCVWQGQEPNGYCGCPDASQPCCYTGEEDTTPGDPFNLQNFCIDCMELNSYSDLMSESNFEQVCLTFGNCQWNLERGCYCPTDCCLSSATSQKYEQIDNR